MVTIELLDHTDGSWRTVEEIPRVELAPRTVKLFWLFPVTIAQHEPTSKTIVRAVQKASLMSGTVRVVHVFYSHDDVLSCVFWQDGKWLRPASHAMGG